METTAPNLREQYMAALLARDAKIWHERHRASDLLRDDESEVLSPLEAARVKPRTPTPTYEGVPCRTCGGTERYVSTRHCIACALLTAKRNYKTRAARNRALSEAEKEKRRAAWTAEKREAQRQRTAKHGKNNGHFGIKGGKRPTLRPTQRRHSPALVPKTPGKYLHVNRTKQPRWASR